jgi:uncharacterized protein YcbK (DUF882 family)
MGDLTTNFSRHEFACKCNCGFDDISLELVDVLQDLREHYDKPIIINSACRCEKHNERVGGAKGSKHKEGIAADIVVSGKSPKVVHAYLINKYDGKYGIGRYNTFTHIDVRKTIGRWG